MINVLMVGTGEYTTGYVHGSASSSDKRAGVVALSLFDLRRRNFVKRLLMAGTNGTKFPGIRKHLEAVIGECYRGLDLSIDTFPSDTTSSDPASYRQALDSQTPGDVVTVFTPDNTHFEIAMAAVERGCHVLIAKPIVQTLTDHLALQAAAEKHNVLVAMEVHKRWDPIYADARDRIRGLGDFSFFQSYMSQPKSQLETFRSWAGKSSDISYYLNAHHIDFHAWSIRHMARPLSVHASAASGVATAQTINTEDTITLTVDWENFQSGNRGTAVYTSSWIAPRSDVHSQQRFFYMGHEGEVTVDQAHRGYSIATDQFGYASANPLFMKYEPNAEGDFAGQSGYGYKSIATFIEAAVAIREDYNASPSDFHTQLATVQTTTYVTAILEAGRRSLDANGSVVTLEYDETGKIKSFPNP